MTFSGSAPDYRQPVRLEYSIQNGELISHSLKIEGTAGYVRSEVIMLLANLLPHFSGTEFLYNLAIRVDFTEDTAFTVTRLQEGLLASLIQILVEDFTCPAISIDADAGFSLEIELTRPDILAN